MFKAILIKKDDTGYHANLTQLETSQLPEGDVTIKISYSSLNYKDGLAISLVSIFAYTPDMFIQPLFGYFADKNQYQFIFVGLILAAILAGISCLILLKMNEKKSIIN